MRKKLLSSASIVVLSFYPYSAASAANLPQGGNVVAGAASLSYSSQRLDINQSTTNAAINWNSFDVGVNNVVNFAVPSDVSTLNHVGGLVATTSQIGTQPFMLGQKLFNKNANSDGSVIKEGTITIRVGAFGTDHNRVIAEFILQLIEHITFLIARKTPFA